MAREVSIRYTLVDAVSKNLEAISKKLDTYEQRLKTLDKTTSDLHKSDSTNLGKWAKTSGEKIDTLGKKLTEMNKQVTGAKWRTLQSYNARVGTLGIKAGVAAGKVSTLHDKVDGLNDVIEKGSDKLSDFAAANEMVGESSKTSARHMRDQASAMRDLNNSVPKLTQAMRSIAKTEREVASAMLLKNKAAKEQSDLLDRVGRKAGFAENRLASHRKELGRFGQMIQELKGKSEFWEGADFGAQIPAGFGKVMALMPALGVAIGGVASMINAVGAGMVGAAGSATTLAGSLAALPGLYAAIGVAAAGAAGVMSTIVTPAVEGLEKLEGLADQIASAREAVGAAGQNITQAKERIGASTTVAGNAAARAAKDDAYAAETKAQANLNKLLGEQAEITKTLPPRAQELVDKIDAMKDSWRDLWFGTDGERAGRIIGSIIEGMSAVQKIMKTLTPSVERFAKMMAMVAGDMTKLSENTKFLDSLKDNLAAAQGNLSTIYRIGKNLLPVIMGLALESQKFTARILEGVEGWSKGIDPEATVARFSGYLDRAYQSLMVWFRALRGFGAGLLTLFSEQNGAVDLFEGSLTSMSTRFEAWTRKVRENGDAAQYFEQSWKVLNALGGVILSLAGAFGTIGSSAEGSDSVVAFLEQLSSGIGQFAGFAVKQLIEFGPKLLDLFSSLGEVAKNTSGPISEVVGILIDMHTAMFDIFNSVPAPLRKLLAGIFALNIAFHGLGIMFGGVIGLVGKLIPLSTLLAGKNLKEAATIWAKVTAQKALNRVSGKKVPAAAALGGDAIWGKKGPAGKSLMGAATRTGAGGVGGTLAASGGAGALGTVAPMAGPSGLAAMTAAAGPLVVALAAVVAIVALLAAGFLAFRSNAEGVADRFRGTVGVVFENLRKKLDKLSEALGLGKDSFKALVEVGGKVGGVLKSIFKWVGVVVVEMGRLAAVMTGAWLGFIIDNLTTVINIVKDLYQSFVNIFQSENKFKALGEFILKFLSAPFRALEGIVSNAMSALSDIVVSTFYNILDNIPDVLKDFLPGNIDGAIKEYKKAEEAAKSLRQEKEKNKKYADDNGLHGQVDSFNPSMFSGPGGTAPKKTVSPKAFEAANTSVSDYITPTAQGAKIQWDSKSVTAFNAVTKTITDKFAVLIMNLKGLPVVATRGFDGLLKAVEKMKDSFVTAMGELSASMVAPFKTHLKELVDQVNSILKQTGSSTTISLGSPFTNNGTGEGSTATTGDAHNPNSGGGYVSVGKAGPNEAGLSSAMGPALALAKQMGGMISSGFRPGAITSSGNKSDHSTGNAIDVTGSPDLMSKIAHAAASLPGVKQVIYSPVGWSRDGAPFSPVTDAGVKANHYDHVHIAMGGNGKGGGGGPLPDFTLPDSPDFAQSGIMSGVLQGMTGVVTDAFQSLIGGSSGTSTDGKSYAGSGDLKDIIAWAAGQYGANADGLVRIAQAESSMNPNAWNKWDSNAMAGIPSKGLFQFIESTFNSFAGQARKANPSAWSGVPMEWLDPKAQSLAASWAFTNGKAPHWATMAAYGRGGDFVTNGPQPIMVGDNPGGRERVTVTPMTGPRAGAAGGRNVNISTTIVVQGGAGAGDVRTAGEEVAQMVTREVIEALRSNANEDI